jgi:hypothetical protein
LKDKKKVCFLIPFVNFSYVVEAKGGEEVINYATPPLLFGKWSYDGVECKDISLLAYLNVKTIKA